MEKDHLECVLTKKSWIESQKIFLGLILQIGMLFLSLKSRLGKIYFILKSLTMKQWIFISVGGDIKINIWFISRHFKLSQSNENQMDTNSIAIFFY